MEGEHYDGPDTDDKGRDYQGRIYMDGDFTLNKLGWYTVETVAPNDFLNDRLESDQYGIYYTVKFVGDAATHLWQAKTSPSVGDKVYGHIEMTKSGKTTKFRRAKKEDTPQDDQGSQQASTPVVPANKPDDQYWEDKNSAIRAQFAIKTAVAFAGSYDQTKSGPVTIAEVEKFAQDFYQMVDRVKGSSESTDPKDNPGTKNLTQNSTNSTPRASVQTSGNPSGYDKFKASRPKTEDEKDAEAESLYATAVTAEDDINLADIPW